MSLPERKNQNEKKSFFKEWLEQLQQESWQLELLISGLALFGIWESRELLQTFDHHRDNNIYGGVFGQLSGILLFIFKVGWRIFFINLLVHVILRGLWIGSIGLRYISGEIEYENLNYSDRMTSFLRKNIGTYDDFIEKLEWICSVLFAYTFLLFLLFLSMVLFFSFYPLVINFLGYSDIQGSIGLITTNFLYFGLGLLVFIDFITLGAFKKVKDKTVSKVFFYIFRFYSLITLSFLYRPLLYNFLDNKGTKRLFFLSVPYILILLLGPVMFKNDTFSYVDSKRSYLSKGQMVRDLNYRDLRSERVKDLEGLDKKQYLNDIPDVVLSQFYMDEPYPSIFLKMKKSDSDLLELTSSIHPIYKKGFRFALFTNSKYDDPDFINLKAELDKESDEVRDSLRSMRIDLRRIEKDDPDYRRKSDSYNLWRDKKDKLNLLKEERITEFEKTKNQKILDQFKSFFEIKLDNEDLSDSLKCHFYDYPSGEKKGLLCHFSSRDIMDGHHEISVKRKIFRSTNSDSLDYLHYILPFIKTKTN